MISERDLQEAVLSNESIATDETVITTEDIDANDDDTFSVISPSDDDNLPFDDIEEPSDSDELDELGFNEEDSAFGDMFNGDVFGSCPGCDCPQCLMLKRDIAKYEAIKELATLGLSGMLRSDDLHNIVMLIRNNF